MAIRVVQSSNVIAQEPINQLADLPPCLLHQLLHRVKTSGRSEQSSFELAEALHKWLKDHPIYTSLVNKVKAVVLGPSIWEKHVGKVDEAPALPESALTQLEQKCIIYKHPLKPSNKPEAKAFDTGVLLFVPKEVDGVALTLQTFVQKIGKKSPQCQLNRDVDPVAIQGPYWVWVSREIVWVTKGKNRKQQVEELGRFGGEVPRLCDIVMAVFLWHAATGMRLYQTCYTRTTDPKLVVGGFLPRLGLCVDDDLFDSQNVGMGIARTL